MSDTVAASPSQLHTAGSSFQTQSSTVGDLITNLNSSTTGLVNSISIAPLTSFSGELETLYGRIGISMNCFTDALNNLGTSLHGAALGFSTTDTQMANTFNILDKAIQPYVGFEAPKMALPTVMQGHSTVQSQPPSWFSQVGPWITTHANQAGSWVATQAHEDWNWALQHPEVVIPTLIIVGGLLIITGGAGILAAPAAVLAL